jgi:RHS repeat-associated protein
VSAPTGRTVSGGFEGSHWINNWRASQLHTDHLGTPVVVTDSSRAEKWRWENDPFGRAPVVPFPVSSSDVNPDDDSGNPYKTCCCAPSCGAGCNQCTTGCSAGQCTGGSSQDVVWTKTYTIAGANNIRLHFNRFDVKAGSTRTGKDYLRLLKGDGSTVIADLTGNLGAFWGPWAGDFLTAETTIIIKLFADNVADGTAGVLVDKLEYTTGDTSQPFVMLLRMPGQVWDGDAKANYNDHRWYRAEDGRYLSPDPIGLAGGEPGYFGYVNSNPLTGADPNGLLLQKPDGKCDPGLHRVLAHHFSDPDCSPGECLGNLASGWQGDYATLVCMCDCGSAAGSELFTPCTNYCREGGTRPKPEPESPRAEEPPSNFPPEVPPMLRAPPVLPTLPVLPPFGPCAPGDTSLQCRCRIDPLYCNPIDEALNCWASCELWCSNPAQRIFQTKQQCIRRCFRKCAVIQ